MNDARESSENPSYYYVYDAERNIGYNRGKPTRFVRVEVTNTPNPVFHRHPISQQKCLTYLSNPLATLGAQK